MIPDIPWPVSELLEVAAISSGGTPSKSRSEYWEGGDVPWITARDMKTLRIGQTSSMLTPAGADEARLMPPGTVFVLTRGMTLFRDLPVVLNRQAAAFNQDVKALTPSADLDAEFLAAILTQRKPELLQHVSTAGHGTGRLDTQRLELFPVPMPPLPEQRKIAEILRTWDDAIDRVELMHLQLLQRRTGLVRLLIFGDGGPHGVSWHQTAPGWDIRPIGEVASDVSSRNTDLTATDVLTCSKHRGFVRSADYFARTVHSVDLSNYKIIRRGQFGFPSNHIEEGSIGLQNVVDVGAVSPIYTVFEFEQSLVDGDFAYLVVKTRAYAHMFDVSTSSSVDRRGNLRWPEFSKLPFPMPPLDEQRHIAGIASDAERRSSCCGAKPSSSAPRSGASCRNYSPVRCA